MSWSRRSAVTQRSGSPIRGESAFDYGGRTAPKTAILAAAIAFAWKVLARVVAAFPHLLWMAAGLSCPYV